MGTVEIYRIAAIWHFAAHLAVLTAEPDKGLFGNLYANGTRELVFGGT